MNINNLTQELNILGFKSPTAIQKEVWNPLTSGENIIGISPTGSGKTLAFLLPLINNVKKGNKSQLLIIEPNQELAMQTLKVVRNVCNKLNIDLGVGNLIGGVNINRQEIFIKKNHPEILIGTLGRITELVSKKNKWFKNINSVVFDEADDLFSPTNDLVIFHLINLFNVELQLSFFSATLTETLKNKVKRVTKDNYEIINTYELDDTQGKIIHGNLLIRNKNKFNLILRIIRDTKYKILLFTNGRESLYKLSSFLNHNKVRHSKLLSSQNHNVRYKELNDFKTNETNLLLATDMSSRGIDIQNIDIVINYDLPDSNIKYIHRTGRTGRMFHDGMVINLGNDHDFRILKRLNKNIEFHKAFFINKKFYLDALPKKDIHEYSNNFSLNEKSVKKRKNKKKKRNKNKGVRMKNRK